MPEVIASFQPMYINVGNKVKELKKDEKGYSRIILGGFNIDNAAGIHYLFTDKVKAMFAPGGAVRRRLDGGCMWSEVGHPNIVGMSKIDGLRRMAVIYEPNICAHIRNVELVTDKDEFGKNVILVIGWISPYGVNAPAFDLALKNTEAELAMSIRSFVRPFTSNGKTYREVVELFTWDWVAEPGIKFATKFNTLAGLESLAPEIFFTEKDLSMAIMDSKNSSLGTESDEFKTLSRIRTEMGWRLVEIINPAIFNW